MNGGSFAKADPDPEIFIVPTRGIGKKNERNERVEVMRFFDRDAVAMIRRNNGVENYQSSSPFPVQRFFRLRPAFFNALYVHALVTLKCRGSIFARLVQFPITRTLLVLEKAR